MSANVFITSDLHLGHTNIMNFGQRDFATIEQHNEAIIELWNATVKNKKSIVWVLGDVAMDMEALKLLDKAYGTKYLIAGNHDRFDTQVYLKYFKQVRAFEKRYGFVMTHIPIHPNEMTYRSWEYNVHGHIHDPKKGEGLDYHYINVNVDVRSLCPVPLDQIRAEINVRKWANGETGVVDE